MATIDFRELPARFIELLDLARSGTEVVVTDGETPRAILVPLATSSPRVAGLHPGAIWAASDFDAPLSDDFWMSQP